MQKTMNMSFIASNIKFLRKQKGLTQEELSKKIGVNRSMIGSYEEGRARPKLASIQLMAHYFKIGVDELVNLDLGVSAKSQKANEHHLDVKGSSLRVLSTLVDKENEEFITVVPVKAAAGYLSGYSDPDFVENLPRFALPLPELSAGRTYRVFQINGNSMEPVAHGSYIICDYVQNWQEIKSGKTYILITKDEGVVYKRVYNRMEEKSELILKSDNPEYEPYTISSDKIIEVWKALGFISFSIPEPDEVSLHKLSNMVSEIKKDVEKLKNKK